MRARVIVAMAATLWGYVFLFTTPRGDRILTRIGKILYPSWLIK